MTVAMREHLSDLMPVVFVDEVLQLKATETDLTDVWKYTQRVFDRSFAIVQFTVLSVVELAGLVAGSILQTRRIMLRTVSRICAEPLWHSMYSIAGNLSIAQARMRSRRTFLITSNSSGLEEPSF